MSFLGPVTHLGGAARAPARPRGRSTRRPTGTAAAQVRRVVRLGFEVRVDLDLEDGAGTDADGDARSRTRSSRSPGTRPSASTSPRAWWCTSVRPVARSPWTRTRRVPEASPWWRVTAAEAGEAVAPVGS